MRYNYYFEVKQQEKQAMELYAGLKSAKASQCPECKGFCESSCPYQVPIRGLLSIAHEKLSLPTRMV
jgi:predicted aldo/keto reductase-like oxidoreductase